MPNNHTMDNILFQDLFKIHKTVEVRINVTNICNLHCDYCDNGCNTPFSKNSYKVFRRKPYIIQSEEITKFCHVHKGVGEQNIHILQGGEITLLPLNIIVQYIEIFRSFRRKVGLRTNGYNVCRIPIDNLNQLECIYLNSHGTNQMAIDLCYNYLTKHYLGKVIIEQSFYHRDLDSLVNNGKGTIEQGKKCSYLLATLTSIPPVIYPCCNSWALMNALNSSIMRDALVDAGWTLDNPKLIETLIHWRQTLPRIFYEVFCADSCYLNFSCKEIPLYRIQPHPKDKITKE